MRLCRSMCEFTSPRFHALFRLKTRHRLGFKRNTALQKSGLQLWKGIAFPHIRRRSRRVGASFDVSRAVSMGNSCRAVRGSRGSSVTESPRPARDADRGYQTRSSKPLSSLRKHLR